MKKAWQRRIKRLIDVSGSVIGLIALSPLLVGAAAAIVATMGWPVIFRQQRPGLNGEIFTLYKFRTMRPPRTGEGPYFRTDAQRLTRLGRFLRATSIDELPELWNVLKGEMSIVGPRPLLVEYLDRYSPEQARRHEVRPGITGWAQVNGRQAIAFSKRLALDVWYVDNWSLSLDMRIIIRTLADTVRSRGVISGQNVDDVDDLGLTKEHKGVDRAQNR